MEPFTVPTAVDARRWAKDAAEVLARAKMAVAARENFMLKVCWRFAEIVFDQGSLCYVS